MQQHVLWWMSHSIGLPTASGWLSHNQNLSLSLLCNTGAVWKDKNTPAIIWLGVLSWYLDRTIRLDLMYIFHSYQRLSSNLCISKLRKPCKEEAGDYPRNFQECCSRHRFPLPSVTPDPPKGDNWMWSFRSSALSFSREEWLLTHCCFEELFCFCFSCLWKMRYKDVLQKLYSACPN